MLRRVGKWVLALAVVGAAFTVAFSPAPEVWNLDMEEAVLAGDYAVVVTFQVRNLGGPGFCGLRVRLTYADQGTWTRDLRMFMRGGERRQVELVFREPHYLAGVLTGLARTLTGDVAAGLESLQARVVVERTWPPGIRSYP